MKLLESYSRSTSTEIKNKPTLFAKYFPFPVDKYITLQNKSGMSAKDFSYFQEIVDLLLPVLNKEGIKIVLLGQDSPPLNNVINLSNQTSIGQCYYILKKSLCHVSVDSWSVHAACAEEIPCVAVYGSTTVANHSPYHFNPDKSIFLESHRNGQKASFQRDENPKSIDLINPEDIVAAACKLLKLDFNYPYKTLGIGKFYQNRVIESDCSNVINISQIGLSNIILRMDYSGAILANLIQQLSFAKSTIVTDKPLPINILQQYRQNVLEVVYKITEKHEPLFVKELQDNKIPYRMFSELSIEKLNEIKLDYIDAISSIVHRGELEMPLKLRDKDLSKIFYKCNNHVISKGNFYQSKYDADISRTFNPNNPQPQKITNVNKLLELWKEQDYCIFLEKI